jgi:endogenous inhibitor of DNA gyrase (YacG/DUF329 family)
MPKLVCPTCKRRVEYTDKSDIPYRPFCSQRCKWLDLAKWLNEEYRVSTPVSESDGIGSGPPDEPFSNSR